MSVPWETIIKLYRKELNDNFFDTIEEYKNDFLKYLKEKNYYTTKDSQLLELKRFAFWNLNLLKDETIKSLTDGKSEDELTIEFNDILTKKVSDNIQALKNSANIILDFKDYTLEQFFKYSEDSIKEILSIVFEGIQLNNGIENLIIEQYFYHLRTNHFLGNETGLVFGGFGEKEIYPSMYSIKIAEVIDNRLRYYDDIFDSITDNNTGSIMPFAQTDVINMFIKGVDPEIDFTYTSVFQKLINKYNKLLIEIVKDEKPELAEQIDSIDVLAIVQEFQNELEKVKSQKQIIPTVDTVAILSKEDLAEMAESLIYLTYLKRRISSDEESVGGPIDVAIISKGDGFIWKKRKHYFDENLNKHFMVNYFKH